MYQSYQGLRIVHEQRLKEVLQPEVLDSKIEKVRCRAGWRKLLWWEKISGKKALQAGSVV